MNATPPKEYITEKEVEARYGIQVRTLQNWRQHRRVLKFCKIGKLVRYDVAELEAYSRAHTVEVGA